MTAVNEKVASLRGVCSSDVATAVLLWLASKGKLLASKVPKLRAPPKLHSRAPQVVPAPTTTHLYETAALLKAPPWTTVGNAHGKLSTLTQVG